jgi:hypothetical protein
VALHQEVAGPVTHMNHHAELGRQPDQAAGAGCTAGSRCAAPRRHRPARACRREPARPSGRPSPLRRDRPRSSRCGKCRAVGRGIAPRPGRSRRGSVLGCGRGRREPPADLRAAGAQGPVQPRHALQLPVHIGLSGQGSVQSADGKKWVFGRSSCWPSRKMSTFSL